MLLLVFSVCPGVDIFCISLRASSYRLCGESRLDVTSICIQDDQISSANLDLTEIHLPLVHVTFCHRFLLSFPKTIPVMKNVQLH